MPDYYALLKVNPGAPQEEIEEIIDARLSQCQALMGHPDAQVVKRAEAARQTLEKMRAVLSSPEQRAAYDAANGIGGAPVETPVAEPAAAPDEEQAIEPAVELAAEPVAETGMDPAAAAVEEQAIEPAVGLAAEPVAETGMDPAAAAVEEQAIEPAVELAAEPVAETGMDPAAAAVEEQAIEPVVELAAAPVGEPVAEPVSPAPAAADEPALPPPAISEAAALPEPAAQEPAFPPQSAALSDAWICAQCHHPNPVDTQACAACGQRIGAACPSCGKIAELSKEICPHCKANKQHVYAQKQAAEIKQLKDKIAGEVKRMATIEKTAKAWFAMNVPKASRPLFKKLNANMGCAQLLSTVMAFVSIMAMGWFASLIILSMVVYGGDGPNEKGVLFILAVIGFLCLSLVMMSFVRGKRQENARKLNSEVRRRMNDIEQQIRAVSERKYPD